MSLDDVLFGLIIGGVGLCAAHFRDEYLRWREQGAAERRKETSMRRLYDREHYTAPRSTAGSEQPSGTH
jgi:hypothetical protein